MRRHRSARRLLPHPLQHPTPDPAPTSPAHSPTRGAHSPARVLPAAVAERRQLFFDDALLDSAATTATRQAHTIDGGDDPIVVLRPDESWERGKSLDHASVLYDPVAKNIKLYYSLAANCGVTCDQKTDEEDGMLGFAESTDGIHFSKPRLGLVNDTNLLGVNVAGPSVFLNTQPGAAADERFVSVGKCHGAAPMCPYA